MRILLITKSFSRGGSSTGSSNLAHALVSQGVEVVKIDSSSSEVKVYKKFARFLERVFDRLFFNPEVHCFKVAPASIDLIAAYYKYMPDIIQLCDISGNIIDFDVIPDLPCPVIHRMSDFWPYHGPAHYSLSYMSNSFVSRWLFSRLIYAGDCLPCYRVAPSAWLARSLESGQGNVRVIKNAIKIPSSEPKALYSDDRISFGFLSNNVLDPRKGFLTLSCKLQSLVSKGYSVSLHVFGNGGGNVDIEGVDVIKHGGYGREELEKVFNCFDILLCPSKLDNSPNVLCESLAHGRPVIAQSTTGMDSYVCDGIGFLHDFYENTSSSKIDFQRKCEDIVGCYDSYSRNAIRYSEKELSLEVVGRQYIDLFDRALSTY